MLQKIGNSVAQRSGLLLYTTATVAATKQMSIDKVQKQSPASTTATKQQPLISCKRSQFNLYVPAPENTAFGTIPLASDGWKHYKSKHDFFKFHAIISAEKILAEMQTLEDFFSNSGLRFNINILGSLKEQLGVTRLTTIQSKGIPKIYENCHVLLAAETGCGKTLVYLLPIIQRIVERKQVYEASHIERRMNSPLAIIITPGRELATQIGGVAEKLCVSTNIKVKTILGGNTKRILMNPEFDDVDILVASMGALSKLATTGIYRMDHVRHVVLDEADTLLDDSFSDKLSYFLKRFPFHKHQTQDAQNVNTQLILASATMPTNVEAMFQKIIDIETLHQIISPNLHKLMPHVEQKFIRMTKSARPMNLLEIVQRNVSKRQPLIVFSNRSVTSDFVDIFLNKNGIKSVNLNGDMLMKIRLGRFELFQQGEYDVLSTTDVGSRGLDTTRARQVVNFDFPLHVSDYIHRCGRIGRMSNLHKSLAINFISSRREVEVVQRIEHAARTGGLLPNVNANIKNIINKRIMKDMSVAGIKPVEDEIF